MIRLTLGINIRGLIRGYNSDPKTFDETMIATKYTIVFLILFASLPAIYLKIHLGPTDLKDIQNHKPMADNNDTGNPFITPLLMVGKLMGK